MFFAVGEEWGGSPVGQEADVEHVCYLSSLRMTNSVKKDENELHCDKIHFRHGRLTAVKCSPALHHFPSMQGLRLRGV